MFPLPGSVRHLWQRVGMLCPLLMEAARFLWLCLRPSPALAAENLFLRKQLALYQERHITPRRATGATRFILVWLAQWFDWRQALTVVHPETFKRWQRQGCQRLWRNTGCPGRPPIPVKLQGLIRQMTRDNLTWGQRRIANELRLKLGLQVSPRTVRKYMPQRLDRGPGHCGTSQRWGTFVRNHAWDLIRAAGMDLSRSVQAVSARMGRYLQCWRGRAARNGGQGPAHRGTRAMVVRREALSAPVTWAVDIGYGWRTVERSPPGMGPPHNQEPGTTSRASPEDTLNVCPTISAGYGRKKSYASLLGTKLVRQSAPQAALIPQAA
jgi:hypothetical protein